MTQVAIITGSSGGIGKALIKEFKCAGYFTIGIDIIPSSASDKNITCDLSKLVNNKNTQKKLYNQILKVIEGHSLSVLVNNAATQILDHIEEIELSDFKKTLDINLTAPFLLSKMFYQQLKSSTGSILNIGSIHSEQTKPNFISYATSKAALKGLTQAMAVDFGKRIRVNIIQPAAISTGMLIDGFKDNPEGLIQLEEYHPSGFIGEPTDIAKFAVFLCKPENKFINGSCIDIDGGIGHRLHDPD